MTGHTWRHLQCTGSRAAVEPGELISYRCTCPVCGKNCARTYRGKVHPHKADKKDLLNPGWDANGSPTE